MKSVLISIQPKWCELITSGKKTVEVRKTKPKLETPFKVYIYETLGKTKWCNICKDDCERPYPNCACHEGWGKVIGEFVCDRIIDSFLNNNDGWFVEWGCLTQKEIDEYQGDKAILYGWHISKLKIYDKPKELSEFSLARHCFNYKNVDIVENAMGDYVTQYFNNPLCRRCMYYDNGLNWCEKIDGKKAITRPPQSWCYVESEDTE